MPTRLIRSPNYITAPVQGGVVTIGNFDGVHLGHQALLKQMQTLAKAEELSTTVLTFEPHPFEFFNPGQQTVPRLTRLKEKYLRLAANQVDNMLILPFNQELASLSAQAFVNQILVQGLKVKHLIIGDDFRFGYQRQGDFDLLKAMGKQAGFTVQAMPTTLIRGERVSSTRIRQALLQGEVDLAAELLGYPYTILGRVAHGNKLGRELGFPTANLHLRRSLTPVNGIYTVCVHGLGQKPLPGVASIGNRPTVDGSQTLLEVHLLDFDQYIYGREVSVQFCKKLRDEQRFSNLQVLKEWIAQDVAAAKEYFKGAL